MTLQFTRKSALLAGLAAAGITVLALRGEGASGPVASLPVPVQAFTVGSNSAQSTDNAASFAAIVHRDREAVLSFRLAGRLAASPARPGQQLAAGAVVAALEATPWQAAATRAAAEADRASRAAARTAALLPAGAVAEAQTKDAASAAEAARAALAAARYDLGSTRLTMPFAGVVLSRHAELGETVAAGQQVVSVADLRAPLVATVQVPAALATSLKRGSPAQLRLADSAQPILAQVLRIAGGVDLRSGTVAVDLTLFSAPLVPSGSPASASFPAVANHTAQTAQTLIPAEALLEAHGDRASVFVIDGSGHARRQPIRFLGFADRDAIVTGLANGVRIVTAGAGFLSQGQAVEVTQP